MHITDIAQLPDAAQEALRRLAEHTGTGAHVLALHGNLGAGKTAFVQALARVLGITETVNSPTFVVMKQYAIPETKEHAQARVPYDELIHIDAYRVDDIDEMRVLRFKDLLAQKESIICIEWAEHIASLLPPHTLHLNFALKGQERTITFS